MPKIMLIEDDQVMIGLLQTLLGIEGYEVVAFQGDAEILSAIRHAQPNIILLDVNLKNLGNDMANGFDLLKTIREQKDICQTRVIMSSGMNYQEESKLAGADAFIMKPYMPDDLLKLIKLNLN